MTGRGRYSPANLIRSEDLPTTRGTCVHLPAKLDDPEEKQRWEQQLRDPAVPKIIDLFCGAGGMSEGFVNAGFAVIAAVDYEKYACETFAANIPARVECIDISKIEDPATLLEGLEYTSIDVIVGGPPCQGFSTVGRARILSLQEEQRRAVLARNELYQQFFRFIEYFRPPFFVMENVPTFTNFEEGIYFKGVKQECERLGYFYEPRVLDAADYGVPQVRRRLFIVGSRVGKLFRWPRPTHEDQAVSLLEAIGDLPAVEPPALVECRDYSPDRIQSLYQQFMRSRVRIEDREKIYDHVVRPVREDDKVIFSRMKPGQRYIDIDKQYRRYNSESFKDKYYKLRPDMPGVTITAHMAKDGYRYIHWDKSQYRTISVREAARIQSFGDHFRFAGFRSSRFREIGNAVPPLLSEAIARQVLRAVQINRGFPGVRATVQPGLPGYERWSTLVGHPDE
jgi:DNA (cytosine-5)-methyltransferase 1